MHIADFAAEAFMTNQQQGLNSGDATGFDFPDLDGGPLGSTRGLYESVIRTDLGVSAIHNDWSYAAARGVSTDWVINIPGQYLMVNYAALADSDPATDWDFRDLPVRAAFTVYDREEGSAIPGGLVVSPSPAPDSTDLPNEVNVIEWGPATVAPVLDSVNTTRVDPSASGISSEFGWASLSVSSSTAKTQAICDLTDVAIAATDTCTATTSNVPMTGFVAWQRTFADAAKNYGRIVEHSFGS